MEPTEILLVAVIILIILLIWNVSPGPVEPYGPFL